MTIEQRMEHLEFEIERLNLRNRRWRRLACTMAVLVVAGVGIGAAQMNEDELRLRKLVIEDDKGGDRIVLDGVADILTSRIHLRDEKGRDRIVLSTNSIEAAIVELDSNGKSGSEATRSRVVKLLPPGWSMTPTARSSP